MRPTPHAPRRSWIAFASSTFVLALAGCEDSGTGGSGGTGGSATITAPGIVGPNSSTPITDTQPTLTVTNASVSTGATPTYTFQVATDQGFGSIVAQASGIAQGSAQTSWDVSQTLGNGPHFWRARADVAGTAGPFSQVAQFTIATVGPAAGETLVVFDDLTDGSSLATDGRGGSFTPQGWRVNDNGDFLRYEVPTIESGYVQWENVGLTMRGANEASHMLFGMWDPTAGAYRQNAFRVHLQKLWSPPHNPPFLRFRWISQGREEEGTSNFNNYNPGTVYTWRIEWGPEGAAHAARVFLNGEEMTSVGYNRPYQPNTHWIELGIQERGESVIDAIYRNFLIVRR